MASVDPNQKSRTSTFCTHKLTLFSCAWVKSQNTDKTDILVFSHILFLQHAWTIFIVMSKKHVTIRKALKVAKFRRLRSQVNLHQIWQVVLKNVLFTAPNQRPWNHMEVNFLFCNFRIKHLITKRTSMCTKFQLSGEWLTPDLIDLPFRSIWLCVSERTVHWSSLCIWNKKVHRNVRRNVLMRHGLN